MDWGSGGVAAQWVVSSLTFLLLMDGLDGSNGRPWHYRLMLGDVNPFSIGQIIILTLKDGRKRALPRVLCRSQNVGCRIVPRSPPHRPIRAPARCPKPQLHGRRVARRAAPFDRTCTRPRPRLPIPTLARPGLAHSTSCWMRAPLDRLAAYSSVPAS